MMDSARERAHILVTGGTGFLGRRLVEYLVGQGERVRVLGRRAMPCWQDNGMIEYLRGDIADSRVIKDALAGVEVVYHLAATTQGDWATHSAVTVDATARLLETVAEEGGGRVVLVSTLMVYDSDAMRNGATVDENFPMAENLECVGNYARAKIEAEHIARNYLAHPLVKLTIVRPGIIYGPGMHNPLNGVAVPLRGKLLVVLGIGDKDVPLIYVDDVSRALVEIMNNEATEGRVYNLIHPDMPNQNDYLTLYRKLSGDTRPVVRIPPRVSLLLLHVAERVIRASGARRASLVDRASRALKQVRYTADHLERDTGFAPCVGFQEGLQKMLGRGDDGC